jgi:hypothetical protein
MRYYQRVGKRGGVSMPIWMLPVVGLVWLFTAAVMALACAPFPDAAPFNSATYPRW